MFVVLALASRVFATSVVECFWPQWPLSSHKGVLRVFSRLHCCDGRAVILETVFRRFLHPDKTAAAVAAVVHTWDGENAHSCGKTFECR